MLDDGTKKYTPGVSSRQGSTSTFQHSGLKNATEQSNSSQSVTATKKYDAFGNTVSSSGTWQGPFGYAGSLGYQEDPNGLKLLGHRYYDSGTGRFMSSDPAGHGRNWYAYAGNDPVSGADPSGLWRVEGRPPNWAQTPGEVPGQTWANFGNTIAGLGDYITTPGFSPLVELATGEKFSWTRAFRSWTGTADTVDTSSGYYALGTGLGAAAEIVATAGLGGCFTEQTDVLMADGSTRDIKDVDVGDHGATFDTATGKKTTRMVVKKFIKESESVYAIQFADGDVVEATGEHPFLVFGRGWIHASGLKNGDAVRSAKADVRVVSVIQRDGARRVYNFEVERTHTYFVGNGKLVHNSCAQGVYALVDDAGTARYIGQSAFMPIRKLAHKLSRTKRDLKFKVLVDGVESKSERLILEQIHINLNGGVKGGQLLNRRNAIGPRNALASVLEATE